MITINNVVKAYRRKVKANIYCSKCKKRELLLRFDKVLFAYMEDDISPSAEHLINAFGTPKAMARALMSELAEEERIRYGRYRRCLLGTAVAFTIAIVSVLSIWLFTSLYTEKVYSTDIVYISEPVYNEGEMYMDQNEGEQQEDGKKALQEEVLP